MVLAAGGVLERAGSLGSWGGVRKGAELGGARGGELQGKTEISGGKRRCRAGDSGVFNPLGQAV